MALAPTDWAHHLRRRKIATKVVNLEMDSETSWDVSKTVRRPETCKMLKKTSRDAQDASHRRPPLAPGAAISISTSSNSSCRTHLTPLLTLYELTERR